VDARHEAGHPRTGAVGGSTRLTNGAGERDRSACGYRLARPTICVGLTKRSAISSQISVVTM